MKSRKADPTTTSIPRARWLAYAAAGAATALTGAKSAEAEIHYSGPLNIPFRSPSHESPARERFDLNQGSAYFGFVNRLHPSNFYGVAGFLIRGRVSGQFAGTFNQHYQVGYVSKLNSGDNISTRPFTRNVHHHGFYSDFKFGVLINNYLYYQYKWHSGNMGFVGFKFDPGAGVQYGWARVHIAPGQAGKNGYFQLIDNAYGDAGDTIKAGQMTSAPSRESVPDQGSLGILALGGAGLLAWRRKRR